MNISAKMAKNLFTPFLSFPPLPFICSSTRKKHQACDSPSPGWLRQPARLQRTWEWALSYDSTPMQTGYLCDMSGFSSLLLGYPSKRIPKKIKTDTFWYESKSQDQQKGSGGFEPKNDHPILGDARDLPWSWELCFSQKNGQRICWSPGHLEKKRLFHWICNLFHWHFVDSLVSRTHQSPKRLILLVRLFPPLCFGSSDRSLSLGPLSWRGSYDREDLHLHGGSLPSQASSYLKASPGWINRKLPNYPVFGGTKRHGSCLQKKPPQWPINAYRIYMLIRNNVITL